MVSRSCWLTFFTPHQQLLSVRVDLFLKLSRLVPRRTVAQQLCDAGKVTVNDHPAKPSHIVRVGDTISLRKRDRQLRLRINRVPQTRQTSKEEAQLLYTVTSNEPVTGEQAGS